MVRFLEACVAAMRSKIEKAGDAQIGALKLIALQDDRIMVEAILTFPGRDPDDERDRLTDSGPPPVPSEK